MFDLQPCDFDGINLGLLETIGSFPAKKGFMTKYLLE